MKYSYSNFYFLKNETQEMKKKIIETALKSLKMYEQNGLNVSQIDKVNRIINEFIGRHPLKDVSSNITLDAG